MKKVLLTFLFFFLFFLIIFYSLINKQSNFFLISKAYELSTLTGTQVLLLVASETGHVYTFATPKLQPLITKQEGKHLIQTCLNSPGVEQVPFFSSK